MARGGRRPPRASPPEGFRRGELQGYNVPSPTAAGPRSQGRAGRSCPGASSSGGPAPGLGPPCRCYSTAAVTRTPGNLLGQKGHFF